MCDNRYDCRISDKNFFHQPFVPTISRIIRGDNTDLFVLYVKLRPADVQLNYSCKLWFLGYLLSYNLYKLERRREKYVTASFYVLIIYSWTWMHIEIE